MIKKFIKNFFSMLTGIISVAIILIFLGIPGWIAEACFGTSDTMLLTIHIIWGCTLGSLVIVINEYLKKGLGMIHYERKYYGSTGCGIGSRKITKDKLKTTLTPSKVTCPKCCEYLSPYDYSKKIKNYPKHS